MNVRVDELGSFAATVVSGLPTAPGERAHVIGLSGELGAGKTTFVQALARTLGVKTEVTSPTYVIASKYPISLPAFTSLIHIDAYRITENELPTIGWDEYISDPKNLVVVEWPERLGSKWSEEYMNIEFKVVDQETRTITYVKK